MTLNVSRRQSFLFLFLLFYSSSAWAQERLFDVIIRKALIFDGKAVEGVQADVAITKDKIVFIGDLKEAKAEKEIQAKGLILAPGFIDSHTHSDFNPLVYPDMANKLEQGITTEITGNCGMSAAPVTGLHQEKIRGVWAREGVQIPEKLPWVSFQEYRAVLERQGLYANFAGLAGHGNLRSAVMGFSPRPASKSEVEDMKKLLAQAMEEGAYGISFGLGYVPGMFADHTELVELCREAARHVGLCSFHIRNEGNQLLESLAEAIAIGEEAKAPVQISHLKAGGKANWDKIEEAFHLIEAAKLRGLQIEADAYPYNSGYAELGVMLPDSLYQREDRVAYFKDLFKRSELMETLRAYDDLGGFKWESVVLAATAETRYIPYEGKTLKQIARDLRIEPEKFLVDVLADTSFEASAFYFSQKEDVVQKVMVQPFVAVGSDSIADGTRKPHPRAFGAFPKVLREYVREKKKLPLGEVIRKMTWLPAKQYGIQNRGLVALGYYADLVLFDAGKIKDQSTYQKPVQGNKGIEWVFVNGKPVVHQGKALGVKAGKVLQNKW